MSALSLLILCGRSPRHLYVANALCQVGRPLAIVQETGGDWNLRKTLKKLRPDNLFRKAWRWLRDRRRYGGGEEAQFFFGGQSPHLDRPELVREVPHINHPDVLRVVRQLKPDLICVFGTSLIRGELLREGRLGIINLHGGLSPEYRGADCTFWALYNGEPEKVGCTLHSINEGIDTGNLIAHIRPAVSDGDTELPLFWQAVKDSATIYAEFVRRVEKGERFGVPQSERGRLYQVRQRGLRQERSLEQRLRGGMLKETNLPLRVSWYERSPSDGEKVH
ncbi:MAG: formyl transferase [Thiobacillaceae bacterium]